MPRMEEIYEHHADRYQELVDAEDYEGNLTTALHAITDWKDATVLEAGVGTGRVTKAYIATVRSTICCDRSPHMLAYARRELAQDAAKTRFIEADNLALASLGLEVDIFIEGWSFGHAVAACETRAQVRRITERLLSGAFQNLGGAGTAIVIETLGTNTNRPQPPTGQLAQFYDVLESEHGFRRRTIRTDFRFDAVEKASRVFGFFFGAAMESSVRQSGRRIVPEWTGVWSQSS